MITFQDEFQIATKGRGFYPINVEVARCIQKASVEKGICHIFLAHTSASLIFCENADPMVLADLERFFSRLIPDGDSIFKHTAEGKDDMPAHVRTVLTQNSLTVPIRRNHLLLGTWQGIFLWEHRIDAHVRNIICTLLS